MRSVRGAEEGQAGQSRGEMAIGTQDAKPAFKSAAGKKETQL